MRFAFFSDIHGNLLALEAVLRDMDEAGVDASICVGDLLAFGPRPLEVLERLRLIEDLAIVRGNTERWLGLVRERPEGPFDEPIVHNLRDTLLWTLEALPEKDQDWLPEISPSGLVEWSGLRVAAEHASPGSDMRGIHPEMEDTELASFLDGLDREVFVCGHTHKPLVKEAEGTLIVNDGSVGFPYDGVPQPSWALLEITDGQRRAEIHRVEYDRDAVRRDIETRDMPFGDVMIRRLQNARM
jgi:putative phosphoesterase